MINNLLYIWSTNPATSLVVWAVISMVILYLGRKQAHQVLYGCGKGLYRCMRLWSFSMATLEKHITRRNQELLESRSYASSVITQCLFSGLFLIVGILLAYVHFQLSSGSMSEIFVGQGSITFLDSSNLAALVFILVEIVMGLLLVEALGLTHLFPKIAQMDGLARNVMAVCVVLVLTAFASVQASLFDSRYMKALGFILPFTMAFIAIPLESFVQSVRLVLGALIITVLKTIAVSIRILGSALNSLFMIFRHVYDLFIVVPLGVERIVKSYLGREVQIDVPMLTRVEAEALKTNQLKSKDTKAKEAQAQVMASKATFKTISSKGEGKKTEGKRVIEDSTIAHINLAETMMGSHL